MRNIYGIVVHLYMKKVLFTTWQRTTKTVRSFISVVFSFLKLEVLHTLLLTAKNIAKATLIIYNFPAHQPCSSSHLKIYERKNKPKLNYSEFAHFTDNLISRRVKGL